ncbi:hypothetical protein DV737_g2923, partial [Chaetothyriales sp. CBS 132003]
MLDKVAAQLLNAQCGSSLEEKVRLRSWRGSTLERLRRPASYSPIMDHFWAAPPVSRTIVAAMFVESLLVYSRLLNSYWVPFAPSLIFKLWIPQVWRLATPFLITGGGFSFVFDLYFTWTYATGLELNSSRFTQPGDFFTYVVFCAVVIILTSGFLLGSQIFTSSLLLAFIYTFAQDNRGTKAHFVIVQIPVEYLPWAMLTLTLVTGGPAAAMDQGSGLVAAHLYDFLTRLYPTFQGGRNWIQTPTPVKRFFGTNTRTRTATTTPYGTMFRPAAAAQYQTPQSQSRGWTSSWSGRGQGRRLGGD